MITHKVYKKSYLVFEEPDHNSHQMRSEDSIPFDLLFYLIILLRKIGYSDQEIGSLFSKTILKNLKFKNVIVLSQSMIEFFRGFNNELNIFDLQHGIIYSHKESYIEGGSVNSRIEECSVNLLLSGKGFQKIIQNSDKSEYFKDKSYVLGVKSSECFLHEYPNKSRIFAQNTF